MTYVYPRWDPKPWEGGLGRIQPTSIPWQQPTVTTTYVNPRPALKCKCGKPCAYRKVAKETETLEDGNVVVKVEAEAVVCPADGVIAWL